jgi:hypothetical protein
MVPAPASELYISDWFLKARHLVEKTGAPWFILSAEHGLVDPNEVIAPYEKTLNKMGVSDRQIWAARVIQQIERSNLSAEEVVIFASAKYRENLMPWMQERFRKVIVPMERMEFGRQKSWMKNATIF